MGERGEGRDKGRVRGRKENRAEERRGKMGRVRGVERSTLRL